MFACSHGSGCLELALQLLAIGVSNGAVIALNALGVTLVYGAVRIINVAHGDMFALTTVLVAFLIEQFGLQRGFHAAPLVGALVLTLVAAMLFGAALNIGIERAAFRPFRFLNSHDATIATFGLSFMLYQVALLWRKTQRDYHYGEHRSVPGLPEVPVMRIPEILSNNNLVAAAKLRLHVTYTLKDLLVLLIAVGLTGGVGILLQYTRIGRSIRAVSQDRELAQLSGVDPEHVIRLVFALGGAVAGAGAFVFTLYYDRPFGQHGLESGLIALTAAVLGGIGRPRGAFIGSMLLGIVASFSDYFLHAQWTPVLVLALLIVGLMLRPRGLFGDRHDVDVSIAPSAPQEGDHNSTTPWRRFLPIILITLSLVYPILDAGLRLHTLILASSMLLWLLSVVGFHIIWRFAGIMNLGYVAAYALGAYTAAFLTTGTTLFGRVIASEYMLVLGSAAIVGITYGTVLAFMTRRMRGDYIAIATLSTAEIVRRTLLNFYRITGGDGGMAALPPPRILSFPLTQPVFRYYFVLVVVLIVIAASARLAHSRLGRAWNAIRLDPVAAAGSGVGAEHTIWLAHILSAGVAAVAGALFANVFSFAHPQQASFLVGVMVLAAASLGRGPALLASVVGGLLIAGYDQFGVRLLADAIAWLPGWNGPLANALDLRSLSYGTFGLALYLTVVWRTRTWNHSTRTAQRPVAVINHP
ncbi:MAG: hypothetical protein NVS4B8_01110 [Herpetosiphon sp.]